MTEETLQRLRGLQRLVEDGVEHGCAALERVHRETAARSFRVTETLPPIAAPSRTVHAIHDLVVGGVYGTVRRFNRLLGRSAAIALELVPRSETPTVNQPGAPDLAPPSVRCRSTPR
ncbi:MAG: hypothetical protein IT371_22435 [Deltaproteobacteria bacterium]|nr:hypothetical protein [Deltaproteobacteria bacterium]